MNETFYKDVGVSIKYFGYQLRMHDEKICCYFHEAAEFIEDGLSSGGMYLRFGRWLADLVNLSEIVITCVSSGDSDPKVLYLLKFKYVSGTVLVIGHLGNSRSVTLAMAYLMIKKKMNLFEAARQIAYHRIIGVDRVFLEQLYLLNQELELSSDS